MTFHLPQDANVNSPQLKVILEWFQGWEKKNLDIVAKCLHRSFRRVVYPQNLGEPTENKEEFLTGSAVLYAAADIEVASTQLTFP
jgi:hypothetical protein